MKQIIIIALALLSLGSCKKEEPLKATTQPTVAAVETYENETFFFAQMTGLGTMSLSPTDLDGNAIGSLSYTMYECSDFWHEFTDGESIRLKYYGKNVVGQYVNLEFEGVVTYEDGQLTVNKTGGNYNMFYSNDCGGITKHLIK